MRQWYVAAAVLAAACGASDTSDTSSVEAPTTPTETRAAAAPAQDTAPAPDPRLAALPEPYNTASLAAGARVWQRRACGSCHMVAPDGVARVGPNLYGMFSRRVGEGEGFLYSAALQNADFQWGPDELYEWIANPRTFLPGNRMAFAGEPSSQARRDLIAYLMVESGYEPPAAASGTADEPAAGDDAASEPSTPEGE